MPASRQPDQPALRSTSLLRASSGTPTRMSSRECVDWPPSTVVRIDRIGVVVPVKNEESALPRCLDALGLAASRVGVPVTVVVVLDACTDDSAAVVGAYPADWVQAVAVDANSVGRARAAGMSELIRRQGVPGTWLATTDGDSTVPPNWFTAQLRHVDAGARVVAGTVAVEEWEDRSSAVRARARHDYEAKPHNHIHGANLSFSAAAYEAAGGFQQVTSDEDVRLVECLRANGEPITWATDLPVVTSARRQGRAPRGFSTYLSTLEGSLEPSRGA